MPEFRQGEIFKAAGTEKFGLAVVFGHIGDNFMRAAWDEFSQEFQSLAAFDNPFAEYANVPHQYQQNCWVWFVPEDENHGITEEHLSEVLVQAMDWAQRNGIRKIITNGVKNIDHGHVTKENRASDYRRTRFLTNFFVEEERKRNLKITLISLNDVFLRPEID
jgi:hypothetical protein